MASMVLAAMASVMPSLAQAHAPQVAEIANSVRHPEAMQNLMAVVQPNEPISFAISLSPRDPAGLQTFVDQVSDPKSPYYRQFISPEEVAKRFGPSQLQVNATISYLKSEGLSVDEVSKNNFVITASGPARLVASAFKTSLVHSLRINLAGMPAVYRTNATPLHLPAAIAPSVVSVDGIDTSIEHTHRSTTTTITPAFFQSGYNESPVFTNGFTGQGVNIAIANWDGFDVNNVPLFVGTFGLPSPAGGAGSNVVDIQVGKGGFTDGQGFAQGEGDLDIQSVLMTAPLANVLVYDDSTNDPAAPITTLAKISTDNKADFVTESYGWTTYTGTFYLGGTWTAAHYLHLSMSAQGMTYLAASGDDGTLDFPQRFGRHAYPAIEPEVLIVGGSVLTVDSTTGARVSEVPWGLSGGIGGTGSFDPWDTNIHGFGFNYPPAYQKRYIPAMSTAHPYRLIPDLVSSAGGKNGLGNGDGTDWATIIFVGGAPSVVDGTSFASPATAGALGAIASGVFSAVTPNSIRTNVRFGRLQDFLYSQGTNHSLFNDITTGSSIGTIPGGTTQVLPAVGWDLATGWGSLNFGTLFTLLQSRFSP